MFDAISYLVRLIGMLAFLSLTAVGTAVLIAYFLHARPQAAELNGLDHPKPQLARQGSAADRRL